MSSEMIHCIQDCADCRDACLQAIHNRLHHGAMSVDRNHLSRLMDCVQMCNVGRDFLMRSSRLQRVACRACAETCDECAQSCDEKGDVECAEVCRRCAASCRAVSEPET